SIFGLEPVMLEPVMKYRIGIAPMRRNIAAGSQEIFRWVTIEQAVAQHFTKASRPEFCGKIGIRETSLIPAHGRDRLCNAFALQRDCLDNLRSWTVRQIERTLNLNLQPVCSWLI